MNRISPRFNGTLRKWNDARGFGFVVADHGEQEVFVHVSAFPRGGRPPYVGEKLSFEMELDKDGRKRAVRVLRPGDLAPRASRPQPLEHRRHPPRRSSDNAPSSALGVFVVAALLVAGLGWFGYTRYTERKAALMALPPPVMAPVQTSAPVTRPAGFQCDGRKTCRQMNSCAEAKLFLQYCPGMEMDGDHDGIPCEQSLCSGPLGG